VNSNNSSANKPPSIWAGQLLHLTCVLLLLILMSIVWKMLGQPNPVIFWIAVFIPVLHQVFVWVAWRLELHSSALSTSIGFRAYLTIFFLLFGARFLSLFALAWVDRGTLNLDIVLGIVVTSILVGFGIYAMYSVKRYFGMARAAGGDHFESRYREMPLVQEGIFRFTANGMYLYAFMLFWAIAVGLNSSAALAVAAFSHLYIWVHYYSTEKPDMAYLYPIE